jgi:hypothetical protein
VHQMGVPDLVVEGAGLGHCRVGYVARWV